MGETRNAYINLMGKLLGRRPQGRSRRWTRHVATMGVIRNAYKALFVTPERTKPFGRLMSRCEDKRGVKEIGLECMNRIHLAQDRSQFHALVNTGTNLRVPKRALIFLLDGRMLASQEGPTSVLDLCFSVGQAQGKDGPHPYSYPLTVRGELCVSFCVI
jgi:hypothetical protein